MYQTRQVPHGSGMKYYLESFLREDFIQFGIVLKTDENGAITGLSFNSHNLGTVDIEADRTVQCFRWEDEEEAQKISPVVKHYPTITGVLERDREFTGAVVGEVLEKIGNEYLQQLLSDFFIVRKTATLNPKRLPGGESLHARVPTANSPVTADSAAPPPEEAENSGGVPTDQADPEPEKPKATPAYQSPDRAEIFYTTSPYRPRQPEHRPKTRSEQEKQIERFETWRWKFDLFAGLGVLGLILGLILSAGELRQIWQGIDPNLYCNREIDFCMKLDRSASKKSPLVIVGPMRGGDFREQEMIRTIEPVEGFLVTLTPLDNRHTCWAVSKQSILAASCLFNDKNYGTDYISAFKRNGKLDCYLDDGSGPRKIACFPEKGEPYPWTAFTIDP